MKHPKSGTKGKSYSFSTAEDSEYFFAVIALEDGNAAPLITLLETESGTVHPLMQAAIASMLRTDHPTHKLKLTRVGAGKPKAAPEHSDRDIATFVEGLAGLPRKVAVGKAAVKFEMSDSSIRAAITRHKKMEAQLRKFLKAHRLTGNSPN